MRLVIILFIHNLKRETFPELKKLIYYYSFSSVAGTPRAQS